MIHTHSLGRAARYFAGRPALASGGRHSTFRELRDRVASIAAALHRHGFAAGDRLALLLPNECEYIELVYACAWLGVIAVPLNTRLTAVELDHVLTDASPRGLIRHSSLPVPTVQPPWQRVIDEEPLEVSSNSCGDPIYDTKAILALIYTSGTTGRPKGVALSHANVLENVHFLNYWMPYKEGAVYLHAAPMFHIIDFPLLFAAPAFGTYQVTIPKFSAQSFCEAVEREGVTHTVLVPKQALYINRPPFTSIHSGCVCNRRSFHPPGVVALVSHSRTCHPHASLPFLRWAAQVHRSIQTPTSRLRSLNTTGSRAVGPPIAEIPLAKGSRIESDRSIGVRSAQSGTASE